MIKVQFHNIIHTLFILIAAGIAIKVLVVDNGLGNRLWWFFALILALKGFKCEYIHMIGLMVA